MFLFTSVSAVAQNIFQSDQEFSSFVNNYYLNYQPDKIVPSLDYYIISQYVNYDRTMIAHFYASILKKNTVFLDLLFKKQIMKKSHKERIFFIQILYEINTPKSIEYLVIAKKEWQEKTIQDLFEKIQHSTKHDVLTNVPRNTADLNRLWGNFFATGNNKAITQIISVLYLWEEGRGKEVTIGGAAKWSLAYNAVQHQKVLQIVKNEMEISSGTKRNMLEEIVNKAEKRVL